MPTLTVHDARIPYETRASGPGLVLVHGTGPGAELTWGGIAGRFPNTVIMPDLSGSERAADDGGELTVELLAEQVVAVIADAAGEPADLVGFAETLVVGCARDATVPVQNARELHAAIEGSTYEEIDSGHVVVLERPDDLVEPVRAFLRRPGVAGLPWRGGRC